MPLALAFNIAVWALIIISLACIILGVRAYNKGQQEDFEQRDH